jgi:hypothetical protein
MKKIVGFLILTLCMLALLSVVASAEIKTVELLAGQFIHAGTVTVSYDDGELCVTYDTEDGWKLVGTQFLGSSYTEMMILVNMMRMVIS